MSNATRYDFDPAVLDGLAPDKRRQAIAAMADLAGGHRDNPLWRFDPLDPKGTGRPHWPQHRWLSNWRTPDGRNVKFRLLPGGNRGGKTTTGDVADIIDLIDDDAVPPHLKQYKRWHEPIKAYLVAPSQRAVLNIHLPIFQQWCPKSQLHKGSMKEAFNKEHSVLKFKNGSELMFMTQNMEAEVYQGTALNFVHFDEEPLYDSGQKIFTECMQRLVDYNGDLRMTFTPLNGMTWVYDSLFDPWQQAQPEKEAAVKGFASVSFNNVELPIYCHVVDQDDNPTIDTEGKAAALAMASSDEERFARQHGRFVSFAGKIYSDFSRARHVVPDSVVLDKMRERRLQAYHGGLDPGFRHQAGVIWVGLDDDGVWVGPELAVEQTVISGVAKAIQTAQLIHGLPPCSFIADPAIARMDHQTGRTDQQAYFDAGIQTRAGNNNVRTGINAIRLLMRADRFHVAAGCEVLLSQIGKYRWKSTGRSEDDAPEKPVKRDDHVLDALRYAVMSLPIPEVLQQQDERTPHQRMMARDIRRSMIPREEIAASTIGLGQFD